MTKFKSFLSKFIVSVFIILSFFLTQNAIFFEQLKYKGDPLTVDALTTSISVTNPEFSSTSSGSTSTTGTSSLSSPTSWTSIGTFNKENMRCGVITIKDKDTFETDCKKYNDDNTTFLDENSYPTGTLNTNSGNNVLMINSKTDTVYGYKSSSIELDANSYYAVSVKYFVVSGFASFGIESENIEKTTNTLIKSMDSNKAWATATIFVATKQTEKAKITLNLYLGNPSWQSGSSAQKTNGCVFFDSASVIKYSKDEFATESAKSPTLYDKKQITNEQFNNITSGNGFIENGSFENGLDDWTVTNTGYVSKSTTQDTNLRSSDYNIIKIINSGYIESSPITIEQNKVYRISFWLKTNLSSVDASITSVDKINDQTISGSISSVSSTKNATTNDWNEYVFFVTGNSLSDCDVTLKIGYSSDNSSNDNYLYIDDVTSQEISSADAKNGESCGISYKSVKLTPTPSSSLTISNGYFNEVSGSNYPYDADSWTREDSNSNNLSGVVNLKQSLFNSSKSNFGNPTVKPESKFYNDEVFNDDISNNVLMMYNLNKSNQSTKSSASISASANQTYCLTFNVFTSIKNSTGGANVTLTNASGVTIFELTNINTNNSWKYYTVYFKNYGASQTLSLTLSLGSELAPAQGHAYFDNVKWESTSSDITQIEETDYVKVLNLSKAVDNASSVILTESFDEYSQNANVKGLNDPLYWTGQVKGTSTDELGETQNLTDLNVSAGVLNQNNIANVLDGQVVLEDESCLYIYSATDNYYAFSNLLSFSLDSNSYYKFSIKVKTIGLSEQESNKQTVDGQVVPYGASVILNGVDKSFVGINTNGEFGNTDNWEEFVFYINTSDSITLQVLLGLGSENGLTSGYALFNDLNIIKMTEDNFNIALNLDNETASMAGHVLSVVNAKDEEETTQSTQNTYRESMAWLAIPTILIALGIVAALIGFLIKKYLDNRPVKVTVKNNYDRGASLLKDLDQKNYKTAVNHKLKLLKEELAQSEQYLKEEKEEHAKQKEAYETAKEIAEQDKSVKLESPDKKYTEYEARIEKLEKNIAGIKADITILEEEKEKIEKESKAMHKNDLKGNEVKVKKVNKKDK
ncbi:MAG: hypothetical protein IJ837_00115 [Clostridia bacterium]|nr:hypothetical protein [Clostridia bacterium]